MFIWRCSKGIKRVYLLTNIPVLKGRFENKGLKRVDVCDHLIIPFHTLFIPLISYSVAMSQVPITAGWAGELTRNPIKIPGIEPRSLGLADSDVTAELP